ncbi:hypothetical protein BCR35DRAFT_308293 [Leucosporidium creatinivorum]|uniref:Uncharacterized protein n=1 Tax=Leucosporidium creatinivorum TaxID=106004 RepID=A0A1Y2E8P1_9BASI|nr:hypothetical protein BCR35DRAFT_308293 [Leucosporidium creatinivorum]
MDGCRATTFSTAPSPARLLAPSSILSWELRGPCRLSRRSRSPKWRMRTRCPILLSLSSNFGDRVQRRLQWVTAKARLCRVDRVSPTSLRLPLRIRRLRLGLSVATREYQPLLAALVSLRFSTFGFHLSILGNFQSSLVGSRRSSLVHLA